MNWGKPLLLILILVTLSGYLYFFEIKGAEERKLTEEKKKKEEWRKIQIFPFRIQDFEKIRLMKNNQTITYQEENSVWWMKEPVTVRGNEEAAVDIIQSIINVVETDPVTDNPSDLAQFGLDHPRMKIGVKLKGEEKTTTLLFGSDNPTSTTIYAKLNDSPRIFLVGSLIRWEVSKEFNNLNNRTGPFFSNKEGV